MSEIHFGTDGWRAVIAEDFTFENVRKVAQAICDDLHNRGQAGKGLVVGFDTRFLSDSFARNVAEVAAGNGIGCWLVDGPAPTPAVSLAVVRKQAAGGVMVTASHNPAHYNGIKIKASYGGSATVEMTHDIEERLIQNEQSKREPRRLPIPEAVRKGVVHIFDPVPDYLDQVHRLIDASLLREHPLKVVADSMYGAGSGYLKRILQPLGFQVIELRSELNPAFPGIHPEPIPANLEETFAAVRRYGADLGLVTDGDADRVGIVDDRGDYVDSQKVFALLLQHLYEGRGWRGSVVKTFAVTEMVDRLSEQYGLKLYKRPVGFKYVCELAQQEDILIGGEESGGIGVKHHIPERDGILCCLLMAEMVTQRGKPMHQLVHDLMAVVGPLHYRRIDLRLSPKRVAALLHELQDRLPTRIAGLPVREVDALDGHKFLLGDRQGGDGGWLLIRPSGTEPVVRVYAEMNRPELLEQVLLEGRIMAEGSGGID